LGCSRRASAGSAAASRACSAALARRHPGQLAAKLRIRGRRGVEPAEQGADVQPGAAHDDRQPAARADRGDHDQRLGAEPGGVVAIVRVDHVDQMMHRRPSLLGRRLAGRRVHAAVDLARVGADHLQRQAVGERHRDGRLAGAGGAGDDQERLAN